MAAVTSGVAAKVASAMAITYLAERYTGSFFDSALSFSPLSLPSIILFFALEGTRWSRFWRHLLFFLPWIICVIIVVLVASQLPLEETGDGLSTGIAMLFIDIGFFVFTIYSAALWASYFCCILLSHFRPSYATDPPPDSVVRGVIARPSRA
ncbi:MAG: hypothetical protein PVH19_04985 [Planctomycetia bacterium]